MVGGLKDLGGAGMRTRETKKQMGQPQLGTPGTGQKTSRLEERQRDRRGWTEQLQEREASLGTTSRTSWGDPRDRQHSALLRLGRGGFRKARPPDRPHPSPAPPASEHLRSSQTWLSQQYRSDEAKGCKRGS